MRKRSVSLLALVAVGLGFVAVPAQAAPAVPAGRVAAPAAVAVAPAQPLDLVGYAVAAKPKKKKKTVALTFDDGPSDYTYQVLDVLKRYKVKATFCVVGNNVRLYPKTTLRIVREGHLICNHTRDHANLTKLSKAKIRTNLATAQTQIKAVTKVKPKVVRFPYGASNAKVLTVAKALKLRSVGWDVDSFDWKNPPSTTISARVVKLTRAGDVVLMHDGGGNRSRTVASLSSIIVKLKKKGYTFVVA